nr:hypothetical protein [Tanacetum cinerariifolium]
VVVLSQRSKMTRQREAKGKSLVESFIGYRNLSVEFEDFSDNSINEVNVAGTLVPTVGKISPNSTNTFSAAELEDITYSDDEDDVGAEADFNNLETSITIEAMKEEPLQFKMQKVWVLVDLSYRKRVIGTKWVFRNKKDEKGIVVRNKARLVAQGHTQEEGIDYEEVSSPVARIEAIRLFLAYASFMGFIVYRMDVKSAFLYGTIEEEVYVCQPLGFEVLDYPDKIYVDDIIFGSTNKDLCKAFEKLMKDKFQTSLIRELTFFLGLQVKQKKDGIFISQDKYVAKSKGDVLLVQDDKGISICQEQYTRNLLKKYEISDSSLVKTPMVPPKNLGSALAGKPVNETSYKGMIGLLITATRLDI